MSLATGTPITVAADAPAPGMLRLLSSLAFDAGGMRGALVRREQQLTKGAFFCIALFVDQQTFSPPCRLFRLSPPFAAFAPLSSRFFISTVFFVRSSIVRRSVRLVRSLGFVRWFGFE
jgi:hypothetical protein